jgi:hypothetical protein
VALERAEEREQIRGEIRRRAAHQAPSIVSTILPM